MKTENREPKTETKHTPGPWTHKTLFPAMGGMVFEVNSDGGNVMKIRGGCIPIKQDADLIAAAPELLEALRYLLNTDNVAICHAKWGEGCNNAEVDAMLKRARAAIAKVEGK